MMQTVKTNSSDDDSGEDGDRSNSISSEGSGDDTDREDGGCDNESEDDRDREDNDYRWQLWRRQ